MSIHSSSIPFDVGADGSSNTICNVESESEVARIAPSEVAKTPLVVLTGFVPTDVPSPDLIRIISHSTSPLRFRNSSQVG